MATKKKFIRVPAPVNMVDPLTGNPLKNQKDSNTVKFKDFVMTLMNNPLWMESYLRVRSANMIMEQLKLDNNVMVLDEDDWTALKTAVENPKQLVNSTFGAQTVIGYGWVPSCTPQLLPFIEAIICAEDKNPGK